MSGIDHFLGMGGYAEYVWTAYGLALVVLVGNALSARAREARVRRQLAARLKRKRT